MTRSMKSRRGWVAGVAIAIVLGAVVTWCVSWACALWVLLPRDDFAQKPDLQWIAPARVGWPKQPHYDLDGSTTGWRLRAQMDRRGPPNMHVVMVWETGWPWPSVGATQYEEWGMGPGPKRTAHGAIILSATARRWLGTRMDALPLLPRPLRFAACTAVYGAFIGAAMLVLSRAKRWIRRRRGRCGACGYSLAGISPGVVCPECGGR